MRPALALLLLAAALWPRPAAAQVASVGSCGPGKVCRVARVFTSAPTALSEAGGLCMRAPNGTPWMLDTSANGVLALKWDGASAECPRPGFTAIGWSYTASSATFTTGHVVAGSYSASLAFASFPACVAGLAGRLIYDSTNAVWRVCNGLAWIPQSPLRVAGTCRGTVSDECTDGQVFGLGISEPGRSYTRLISCGWSTAGDVGADGGAGRVVVRLASAVNGDDCRCDLGACGAAGDPVSCTCDKNFATGAVLLQNLQASIDGGIHGDCVTHPGNIFCTAE